MTGSSGWASRHSCSTMSAMARLWEPSTRMLASSRNKDLSDLRWSKLLLDRSSETVSRDDLNCQVTPGCCQAVSRLGGLAADWQPAADRRSCGRPRLGSGPTYSLGLDKSACCDFMI